jgi:hypothetical protein
MKAKRPPLMRSLRELRTFMETLVAVLMLSTLGLIFVVVWLIWTTIKIRGSVSRQRETQQGSTRTSRLDAEIFVETYRKLRSTSGGTNGRKK